MPIHLLRESELAGYAKQCRQKSGRTKIEVAALLGVSRVSIQQAEENPEQHLNSLRIRIIQACSGYEVEGPIYRLNKRAGKATAARAESPRRGRA